VPGGRRTFDGDEAYADEPDEPRRPARRQRASVSPDGAARTALRDVAELTGKQPLGITALERADDDWVVEVEVLEDSRIPSSSDVLGLYRAGIGADGSLVGFRRIRRYPRGKGDGSEVT